MTIRNFLMTLALLMLLLSCGGKNRHMNDVEFDSEKVYINGVPFNGDVWSDDNHSYCLTSTDGVITSFRLFHNNDSTAISILTDSTSTFYDEEGREIPIDSFKTRYKGIYETLPELVKTIKGDSAQQKPAL